MLDMRVLLVPLFVANVALSVSMDTSCLGTDSSVNDETFLSEHVGNETLHAINDGERAFSVNLIKSLFGEGADDGPSRNIFISPASIYQTLTLAFMGAEGNTEKELATVMGIDLAQTPRSEVIKNYLYERAFQAIRDRDPNLGYQLTHANKLYFDRSLPLSQCFQLVLQDELEALDFHNVDKATGLINGWVKEKTRGKIAKLLPPDALDGGTKMALVNAAYFKGDWQSKFEKAETKKDNFYVRRDKIRVAEFMHQKGKFNYYTSEELRAHVLEMPYNGDEISMMIILPPFEDNALKETASRLTPDTLKGVMAEIKSGFYSVDDLTVQLPRFKISQTHELRQTLEALGLKTLFDPTSSELGRFIDASAEGGGYDVPLNSALHKSFIEVNEEGSEAAAATALFGFRSARPLFHTQFIADHPFAFLIYDKPADQILFFGMYQDPDNN